MAILEWFATCVETQPGVIEVFLNIRTIHDSASGQQVTRHRYFSFCVVRVEQLRQNSSSFTCCMWSFYCLHCWHLFWHHGKHSAQSCHQIGIWGPCPQCLSQQTSILTKAEKLFDWMSSSCSAANTNVGCCSKQSPRQLYGSIFLFTLTSSNNKKVPEYQLLLMKVSWWDRNVRVVKEFGCDVWIIVRNKKLKFSHTHYRALGPQLIPVYRQSARRWHKSSTQW